MIEVQGLRKSFGSVAAVRDVSFSALDGRITGLLGPNGAGKSTTLRILSTLLEPDAGAGRIDSLDLRGDPLGVRRLIGVLPTLKRRLPEPHRPGKHRLLRPAAGPRCARDRSAYA